MRVKVLLAQHLRLLEISEGEPHGVVVALDVAAVLLEVPAHEVLQVLLHLHVSFRPFRLSTGSSLVGSQVLRPASDRSEGRGGKSCQSRTGTGAGKGQVRSVAEHAAEIIDREN